MKRWHIVVLVIIIALGLSGIGAARFLMPYELEDEIKAARVQGVATSFTECVKPVPPGDDAAPDYKRCQKLSKGFWTDDLNKGVDALTAPGRPTQAELATLRAAFNNDNGYLAAIHAAAAKPGFSLGEPTAANGYVPFPSMAGLREAAKTLRYEAMLQAYEGKPVEAARTLRLGLNVARHAYAYPTLIGGLVGIAVDGITDAGYRQLLQIAGANPEVDRVVRDSLGSNLSPGDINQALSGEVAMMCAELQAPQRETGSEPFYKRVFAKGQYAAYVHWTTREIVASRVPAKRRRQALQGVVEEFDRATSHNPVLRAAEVQPPIAVKVIDRFDTEAARRRTLYAAACVLEYKARSGRYPVTLSDAVKAIPVDPFSGAPLSYRMTTKGFELLSAEASHRWAAISTTKRRNDLVLTYPAP